MYCGCLLGPNYLWFNLRYDIIDRRLFFLEEDKCIISAQTICFFTLLPAPCVSVYWGIRFGFHFFQKGNPKPKKIMSTHDIVFYIISGIILWGGCGYTIWYALRQEIIKEKKDAENSSRSGC